MAGGDDGTRELVAGREGAQEVIPLARPVLGAQEEQAVLEVLRSGQLSLGPRLSEFERGFAGRVGAPHASAVSSGTAGLHLALRAVGAGDCVADVIVLDHTIPGCPCKAPARESSRPATPPGYGWQ